ncbi:VOC family protein [Staphylococcus durrellii]|uniref:VOC family protein n=1 Tax=Staphylococcus durrellii TaxID=2781773 RepID=UPI00189F70A9|nr:VOC family protein [Staphylococcus durrellii]MBF7016242.1 VOC family protein [Staphylococcus durrellii]
MTFHDKTATQVTGITLNVQNLEQMTQFYTNLLGLKIVTANSDHNVLAIGTRGHTLTLNQIDNPRRPDLSEAGLFHIAILLPSKADLANFLKFASLHRVQISGGDHLVSEALYFNDIEGNGIEIYYDRNPEIWQWKDNFVSMDTLQVEVDNLLAQQTAKGWTGMPDQAQIGHLHLKTANLDNARQFYINKLNFQHVSKFPQALFMSTNYYHHHIAVNTWQSNKKRIDNDQSLGLSHIDIYIPDTISKNIISPEGIAVTLHSNTTVVPN